jgi:hypothetical protein
MDWRSAKRPGGTGGRVTTETKNKGEKIVKFSNIWQHPKTTIIGVLVALATAIPVLAAQGITLGHAGTGTVVGLVGSLTAVFLGALARDPEKTDSAASSQARLGAWALIALVMMASMPTMIGCTQQQRISIAQEIVNWSPTVISTADTVNAAIMALDPATIAILGPITLGINTLGPEFQKAAQAYLINPNVTTLQELQALIMQIQQDTNSALLAAVKIVDPVSQATATRNINLLATIANAVLSLVQSISTKAQVVAMSKNVHVTLAMVRPYMNQGAMAETSARVSHDLQLSMVVTPQQFFSREAAMGF